MTVPERNTKGEQWGDMMNTSRRTLILMCVFVIVFVVCLVETTDGKSEDEGIREITVVTITPKEPEVKEETVNFDLQHLAIAGRDVKDGSNANGNDTEEPESYGEHPGADGAGSEISDKDAFGDEADPEGLEGSVYPEGDTGDEDWEDNVPPDGAGSADTAGEETGSVGSMSELVEPGEYDDVSETGAENYSTGDDGEIDGIQTVSESGLTYLGTWTATAYCPGPCCCGEYASGYTASGTLATEGRTVACNSLPFGTQIYIEGYGYYIVEDTGWSPYEPWLDVFFSSHDAALAFGLRDVEVYMVN